MKLKLSDCAQLLKLAVLVWTIPNAETPFFAYLAMIRLISELVLMAIERVQNKKLSAIKQWLPLVFQVLNFWDAPDL